MGTAAWRRAAYLALSGAGERAADGDGTSQGTRYPFLHPAISSASAKAGSGSIASAGPDAVGSRVPADAGHQGGAMQGRSPPQAWLLTSVQTRLHLKPMTNRPAPATSPGCHHRARKIARLGGMPGPMDPLDSAGFPGRLMCWDERSHRSQRVKEILQRYRCTGHRHHRDGRLGQGQTRGIPCPAGAALPVAADPT